MVDEEKLLELESQYEIGFSELMQYYTMLLQIPCVQEEGDEKLYYCLEALAQSRITNEIKEREHGGMEYMSLEYSISDALYKTYGERAIPYLCEEYLTEREISGMDAPLEL